MTYFHINGAPPRDGNTTVFSFFPFSIIFLSFFIKVFLKKNSKEKIETKKTYEKNFEEKILRNKIRKIDEKIFTVKTKKRLG